MTTTRREFLEGAAATAAALSMLPSNAFAALPADLVPAAQGADWDVSWATRVTGKHRGCFDCTETESGYGTWRASAWAGQYATVLGAAAADISTVIVLRHNAIVLAMQQGFWDKYGIGEAKQVKHPLTEQVTKSNPVLLDEKDGIPAPFNMAGLHKQIARGTIVLACNMALQECVTLIKNKENVTADVARKQAIGWLVPGVILQPSGVFAAVRAQQVGCAYVKAS
jgi:hypothetical protein